MRALLRDSSTGRYFQALDKWTADREEAYDFGVIPRALRFAHAAGFEHLDLILAYESTEPVPALPMETFRLESTCLREPAPVAKSRLGRRGCHGHRKTARARLG
jgi:hypothetical protein